MLSLKKITDYTLNISKTLVIRSKMLSKLRENVRSLLEWLLIYWG